MKQKENEKKLLGVAEGFREKKDSLFAFYSCDKEGYGALFCGNPNIVANGIYNVLKRGLSGNVNESETAVCEAVLNGVGALIKECSIESVALADELNRFFTEEDEDEYNDGFDPSDEECRNCDDFEKCLANMVGKLGYGLTKRHDKKGS